MDRFPDTLVPSSFGDDKNQYIKKMYEDHIMRKFREKVFECVATGNPDNYVDLSSFEFYGYPDFKEDILSVTRFELEALGWKTSLMYGDTALFVFSENNKPKYW
jgi:hypothetical protein